MLATLATPGLARQPDPGRAREHAFGTRRFVGLLRRVITCGKDLLIAVRLRAHRGSGQPKSLEETTNVAAPPPRSNGWQASAIVANLYMIMTRVFCATSRRTSRSVSHKGPRRCAKPDWADPLPRARHGVPDERRHAGKVGADAEPRPHPESVRYPLHRRDRGRSGHNLAQFPG
jgi:hypothetical protein